MNVRRAQKSRATSTVSTECNSGEIPDKSMFSKAFFRFTVRVASGIPSGPPPRWNAVMALTSTKDVTMGKAKQKIITPTSDPIFAAIADHRRLNNAWLRKAAAADRAGNREVKEPEIDRGNAAAEEAAWNMARTKPRTVAGAAALLTYVSTKPTTGLFELGETSWHETAFRNVVAALKRLTRTPRVA